MPNRLMNHKRCPPNTPGFGDEESKKSSGDEPVCQKFTQKLGAEVGLPKWAEKGLMIRPDSYSSPAS
jgi:hypothetical protein